MRANTSPRSESSFASAANSFKSASLREMGKGDGQRGTDDGSFGGEGAKRVIADDRQETSLAECGATVGGDGKIG